jgi:hypothetical protein
VDFKLGHYRRARPFAHCLGRFITILNQFSRFRADTEGGSPGREGVPRQIPGGLTGLSGGPRLTGVWACGEISTYSTGQSAPAGSGPDAECSVRTEETLRRQSLAGGICGGNRSPHPLRPAAGNRNWRGVWSVEPRQSLWTRRSTPGRHKTRGLTLRHAN